MPLDRGTASQQLPILPNFQALGKPGIARPAPQTPATKDRSLIKDLPVAQNAPQATNLTSVKNLVKEIKAEKPKLPPEVSLSALRQKPGFCKSFNLLKYNKICTASQNIEVTTQLCCRHSLFAIRFTYCIFSFINFIPGKCESL